MRNGKWIKITTIISGIGVIVWGCAQLGSLAGNLMTQTTNNLNDVALMVSIAQNAYPKATGDIGPEYAKDQWKDGSTIAVVNFFKKKGIGFYKLDGTITIEGDTVLHQANGVYAKIIDQPTKQTVKISTSSGQKFEATVHPIEPVKIKSINGGDTNIDLSKDLTLEFDNTSGNKHQMAKLSIMSSYAGLKYFTEITTFKIKDKVVFPKEIWNHDPNPLGPTIGANYILIERFDISPLSNENIGALQIISKSWDCAAVNLVGSAERLSISEKLKIEQPNNKDLYFDVDVFKPSAHTGKPMVNGGKYAIVSLTVQATKLTQTRTNTTSSTQSYGTYSVTTTTTTVRSRQFPQFPEVFWDRMVENVYKDAVATLKSQYNVQIVPIENVLKAKAYEQLEPIEDEFSKSEITKTYKGLKNLYPTSLSALLKNFSSTFASDRPEGRLMTELGVDGLIAITVDLEMPWFDDTADLTLSPRMSMRIMGGANGYSYGPITYAQIISAGNGMPFDEAKINSSTGVQLLDQIVRREDMFAAVKQGFNLQDKKEKELGYEKIWNLQK